VDGKAGWYLEKRADKKKKRETKKTKTKKTNKKKKKTETENENENEKKQAKMGQAQYPIKSVRWLVGIDLVDV
jgi:hypothetical protein